jgi:hypothetical protein
VGGRSLTLYEEVHRQKNLGYRLVQQYFLQRMAALLPALAAFPTSCTYAPDGGPVRAASGTARICIPMQLKIYSKKSSQRL